MNKSRKTALAMGFGGIVMILLYLAINQLSVDGPYALRRALDDELVQIVSTIGLFMGGELAVAVATFLGARAKAQAVLGIVAALFGLFLVFLIFALRPGLIPSYLMAFVGPICFVGFLALPEPAPPVIRGSGKA